MACVFFTIIEIIYYLFIAFLIKQYNNFEMINSASILAIFSIILSVPAFISIYFIKNRKKYFMTSSIFIIIFSLLFHLFGKYFLEFFNFSTGVTNFTIYLYKILFMLSPLLSLYFLGLHKLIYTKQKKQLYFIIALKRIIPILFVFVIMHIANFSTIAYILAAFDFILNIAVLIYSYFSSTSKTY